MLNISFFELLILLSFSIAASQLTIQGVVQVGWAERIAARLTAEDKRKLMLYINECLTATIKFDKTGKPEYFVKMKSSIEQFIETLDRLEKEA
ncbi:MAG: hypothetical protein ACPLYF_00665 [Fervidobacterium sp.]